MVSGELFQAKPVIGVIHVAALPGTPRGGAAVSEIVESAVAEARIYRDGGVDGIILENMHDTPYERGGVGPEITAAMTAVACAVRAETDFPLGIQILAGANMEAMAAAHAAGLDFIRAESFAFAHVADEGIIESSAAKLLRYRKLIGADRIQVWADIKKKHAAHAITADVSLGETAEAVQFMRGNAVIVSGSATGKPPSGDDVREAKAHCTIPVLLGSGINEQNVDQFFSDADGFIVGSSLKQDGQWERTVDAERIAQFVTRVRELREIYS
jgi:membrane complex biogenesis BtpA family protein